MLIIKKSFLSFFFLLIFIKISYSYKPNPTQYICIESSNEIIQTLPSCLPGYVLDIENVIYESTRDNKCSGTVQCQIENRNTLLFACNRKRTCQINLNNLRYHINSTCGTIIRFFVQYRCLPVIQEQKDYLCESSSMRRPSLGDINLSCIRNYRLHITMALVGMSLKSQDDIITKNRFKCNKDTQTICNTYVSNGYRDVCDRQSKQECKIMYNQRPILNDCSYGMASNFSLVEYSCIPDDSMIEDLPRIDICSKNIPERISTDRGLLHSPNYSQGLSCKKELFVPRESRLRLYMLEKSVELNIDLLNHIRTLNHNELLDINITKQNKDEIVKFELKINHIENGQFLLYFQVDSPISEYAPFDVHFDRKTGEQGKFAFNRDWAIIIGCILGIILLIVIILIIFRRYHTRRYIKTDDDDDHRQRLNASDHDQKDRHIEQPYLISSAATILPTSANNHKRPHSASSTTSSIIMHQMTDGISDCESLIKPINQIQPRPNKDIDNLYEEIKEQQQQTALALGINSNKYDLIDPYLLPKNSIFQGQQSIVPPIRNHHEDEPRYQHPKSSKITNQQIKRSKKPPPKGPPQPSAPPFE